MGATNSSSKGIVTAALLGIMLLVQGTPAQALFRGMFRGYGTPGFGAGVKVDGVLGRTDLTDKASVQVRGYLSHGLNDKLSVELGALYAPLKGGNAQSGSYRTGTASGDFRLHLSPFSFSRLNPYLYAGTGVLRYQVHVTPRTQTLGAKRVGWTGTIPVGVGMKTKLSERISMDLSGGYTHTFSDVLDASALKAGKDGYWGIGVGLDFHESP